MGIAERKQREKENLRKQILEAAKKLFVEKGFEATSMRNIAESLEFSTSRLYLYYKDKNAIVYELHKEGFRLLSERLAGASQVKAPFERLKFITSTYLDFAQEHPDFYEVMFVLKGPLEHIRQSSALDNWEEGTKIFRLLADTVAACQSQKYFRKTNVNELTLLIWSTLHGITMLNFNQHLDCIDAACNSSVQQGDHTKKLLQLFLNFLKKE